MNKTTGSFSRSKSKITFITVKPFISLSYSSTVRTTDLKVITKSFFGASPIVADSEVESWPRLPEPNKLPNRTFCSDMPNKLFKSRKYQYYMWCENDSQPFSLKLFYVRIKCHFYSFNYLSSEFFKFSSSYSLN